MPRQFLKRHLPAAGTVHDRRELRWLGRLLEDPFLLHLNRRSVAGGGAVGVFVACLPLPGQMLLAGALAILFRVNLVLAVALVWISNPLTMPPMFYFNYVVGTWLVGAPVLTLDFEPTLAWFWYRLGTIWQPLTIGSLTVGAVLSLASYGAVHLAWRLHVLKLVQRRRNRRASSAGSA